MVLVMWAVTILRWGLLFQRMLFLGISFLLHVRILPPRRHRAFIHKLVKFHLKAKEKQFWDLRSSSLFQHWGLKNLAISLVLLASVGEWPPCWYSRPYAPYWWRRRYTLVWQAYSPYLRQQVSFQPDLLCHCDERTDSLMVLLALVVWKSAKQMRLLLYKIC